MTFTKTFTAALLLGATLAAHALDIKPYSAAALADAQKANQPVALHFHADWCPTCRAQDHAFKALQSDKSLNLTILQANYDTETALKQKLGVQAQSTLIVYRGTVEKTRATGETDADKLRSLLKTAL